MFSRRPSVRRLSAVALGAAGSALILAGSTGPASAQFFDWFTPRTVVVEPSPALPAPEVYRRLSGRGYQLNGNMQRNGGVYLADVVDSRGRQQRLVIDAYRGKILQTYATAPPRPSATVPYNGGSFTMVPPGTYASRDPMAPPPSTVLPGQPQPRMVPGFEAHPQGAHESQRDVKSSKKKTKAAAREAEPKAARGQHPTMSPAEATAPPASPEPATASIPTSRPDTGSSVPAKAAIAPQAVPAPVPGPAPASATASTTPVRTPVPAPAAPAANKPGYANGVPINPLD